MATPKWVPTGACSIIELIHQKAKPTTIDKVGGIYCHICHQTFGNKKEYDSHYTQHGTGSSDIIYTCVVCHKEIVGYPSFRGHCYLAHVVKDKFKCGLCVKMFSKQCILETHMKTVHENVYTCSICKKQFHCQKELLWHEMVHKNTVNGPPYECQTCGDQIETSDDCETHIEDHCSMFYSCPICNEDITSLTNAASHLTKHFGEVLIKKSEEEKSEVIGIPNDSWIDLIGGILCCYCDSIHNTKQDFDSHILLDHPNEVIVYSCNICGKEFKKYMNLAHHGYDHTAKDRFKCEECFKTFSRLSLLVIHMEAFHSETKPKTKHPFTCLQCNHGFLTDHRLTKHYRTKHKIYHSQCPDPGCGKTFDTPKDLIFHVKEHNPGHNWCRQCGLRFYSLEACEKHLQYHKKKLYSCPVCSKNYGEKYLILKHLPQHFSAVLHVCKVCGKIYNSRSRLVQHNKVHSKIKPHNCSVCGKGFTKVYLLRQHMNIHTDTKPYKCTNCPKTFASYPNLSKHQRKIHNVTTPFNKITMNENSNQNNSDKSNGLKETLMNTEISNQIHDTNMQENAKLDIKVDTSSVEMTNTTHSFEKSTDSDQQWMMEEVDPIALELLEEQLENSQGVAEAVPNIDEFHKDLWSSSTIQLDSCAAVVPREYGPEFVMGAEAEGAGAGVIPLGDPPLPHIDPRLTLLRSPTPAHLPPSPAHQPAPKWEPPISTTLHLQHSPAHQPASKWESPMPTTLPLQHSPAHQPASKWESPIPTTLPLPHSSAHQPASKWEPSNLTTLLHPPAPLPPSPVIKWEPPSLTTLMHPPAPLPPTPVTKWEPPSLTTLLHPPAPKWVPPVPTTLPLPPSPVYQPASKWEPPILTTLLSPPTPLPPSPAPKWESPIFTTLPPGPAPLPARKWEPPILIKLELYDIDAAMWDEITI